MKEVLYGILQNSVLTDQQLHTVLTEAEHIVNSRPLTHISDDVKDLEPLTPNHILLGRHRNWAAIIDTSASDVFSRKKWRQVQGVGHEFWGRWKKEYLPTLNKRCKWKTGAPSFRVGELVLLRDDDYSKRGKWPLARVTTLKPGSDGVVRSVEIRTKDGSYTRPVTKLYRLEDNADTKDADEVTQNDASDGMHSDGVPLSKVAGDGECVQDGEEAVAVKNCYQPESTLPKNPVTLDKPYLQVPKLSQITLSTHGESEDRVQHDGEEAVADGAHGDGEEVVEDGDEVDGEEGVADREQGGRGELDTTGVQGDDTNANLGDVSGAASIDADAQRDPSTHNSHATNSRIRTTMNVPRRTSRRRGAQR